MVNCNKFAPYLFSTLQNIQSLKGTAELIIIKAVRSRTLTLMFSIQTLSQFFISDEAV